MKKGTPKPKEPKQPQTAPAAEPKAARAVARFLRIGPRKVRVVINTIRHKPALRAISILAVMPQKAARFTEKLLKSCVANAKVLGMDEARLTVADIRADGGPVMKRFMARSMGRADRIIKRTTHLSIILKESDKTFSQPSQAPELEQQKETGKPFGKFGKKTKVPAKKKTAGAKA